MATFRQIIGESEFPGYIDDTLPSENNNPISGILPKPIQDHHSNDANSIEWGSTILTSPDPTLRQSEDAKLFSPKPLWFSIEYCRLIGTLQNGVMKQVLQKDGGIKIDEKDGYAAVICNELDLFIDCVYICPGDTTLVLNSIRLFLELVSVYNKASGVIFVHNHPNGNPTPSKPEIDLSKGLLLLSKKYNVIVRDFVLVGETSWYSFKHNETFLKDKTYSCENLTQGRIPID